MTTALLNPEDEPDGLRRTNPFTSLLTDFLNGDDLTSHALSGRQASPAGDADLFTPTAETGALEPTPDTPVFNQMVTELSAPPAEGESTGDGDEPDGKDGANESDADEQDNAEECNGDQAGGERP